MKKVIVCNKRGKAVGVVRTGRAASSAATGALAPEDRRYFEREISAIRRQAAEDVWSASFAGDSGGDRRGRIRYL